MTSRLKLRKKKQHPPENARYSQIVIDENDIVNRAIASAQKHNIKLRAGTKDRGYGNCAFEAVINNINDRDCFLEKLRQTPNWYRRQWMNEMLESILLGICQWNPGYTENQLREGFAKLQEAGVYEIDYFGDMMMGGIACGTKKRILIFNTSDNLIHDPISVVDPNHYDFRIETVDETPIVVAYNNYHYENLHPIDEKDRQEIIRLTRSYIEGKYNIDYGFTKKDINYLTSQSLDIDLTSKESDKKENILDQHRAKRKEVSKKKQDEEIQEQPKAKRRRVHLNGSRSQNMEDEEKAKKMEVTKVFEEQDKLHQYRTDTKEKNIEQNKTSPETASGSTFMFSYKVKTVNIEEL